MKKIPVAKTVFFLSVAFWLILYGYSARSFGWFPDSVLREGVRQALAVLGPPRYAGPRVHSSTGARTLHPQAIQEGLTLVATHDEEWDWSAGLKLVDHDGNILHQWVVRTADVFGLGSGTYGVRVEDRNVHGAHLFENGDVLVSMEYTGLARMDACGSIIWSLANRAHHSVAPADDGSFWSPVTTAAAVPSSARFPDGYPGLSDPINHDFLLRYSGDGAVLDSISVLDILYENDLSRFLVKARVPLPYPTDLTHINDVEPLSARLAHEYPLFEPGDLLVSIRTASLILVVDPETRRVKWHASDPLIEQHDPDFIGDGWIGVFDNARDPTPRGSMLGGSRILAFQPHTDSLKTLYPTARSDTFYSPFLGKWQLLQNGNLLLTEGRAGRIVEVASDGRTVWEWIESPYKGRFSVEVTEGTRYDLSPDEVSAWSCSNNQYASDINIGGES